MTPRPDNDQRPEDFQELISAEDYAFAMELITTFLTGRGFVVGDTAEGRIESVSPDNEEMTFGLDNIIRQLTQFPKNEWEELVEIHFGRFGVNVKAAYNYFLSDFDSAREYLRVMVKSGSFLTNPNLLSRVDLPGTVTTVVLDYENMLRFLTLRDIAEWDADPGEIFAAAMENTYSENFRIESDLTENGHPVYLVEESNFAVSAVISPERKLESAIGAYGALIAIPIKSVAVVMPVDDLTVLEAFEQVLPVVQNFYEHEPHSITQDFYWYFEGNHHRVVVEKSDDSFNVTFPDRFLELFGDDETDEDDPGDGQGG